MGQTQTPEAPSTDVSTMSPSAAMTSAPSVVGTEVVTVMPTVSATRTKEDVADDDIEDGSKNQGSARKNTYDDDNIRQHSEESSHTSVAYPTNFCVTLSAGPLLESKSAEQPANIRVCYSECPLSMENCVVGCAGSDAMEEVGLIDNNGKSLVQYVYLGKKIKATLFSKKDRLHKTLYYTYKDNEDDAYSLNDEHYQIYEDGELK